MSATSESDSNTLGGISGQSISDAITMLKENPSIISSIASALASNSQAEAGEADTEEGSKQVDREGFDGHRNELNLDKLPEIISAIAPMLSSKQAPAHSQKVSPDHRTALLCALKPYLSSGRQEIIDSIIKISKVSEMIKRLK